MQAQAAAARRVARSRPRQWSRHRRAPRRRHIRRGPARPESGNSGRRRARAWPAAARPQPPGRPVSPGRRPVPAAPALASATKLIPDPAAAGSGDPEDTIFVPAAAVAASNGQTAAARQRRRPPPTTQALPVARGRCRCTHSERQPTAGRGVPRLRGCSSPTPTGARHRRGCRHCRGAAAAASALRAPARSAGAGRVRRIGGNKPQRRRCCRPSRASRPARRPPAPLRPRAAAADRRHRGRRDHRRPDRHHQHGWRPTTGQVTTTTSNQTGPASTSSRRHGTRSMPRTTRWRCSTARLSRASPATSAPSSTGQGYKKGNITNGASQTQANTVVYYCPAPRPRPTRLRRSTWPGAESRPSRVHPADPGVDPELLDQRHGDVAGSCNANVIVSVGQDRANLASGGSSAERHVPVEVHALDEASPRR